MGSLGMPEILVILVIALIIFGPRKLPELGKSLGKSLAQFRRASEDFKRQWEEEVDLERRQIAARAQIAVERTNTVETPAPEEAQEVETAPSDEASPATDVGEGVSSVAREEPAQPDSKRDWM